MGDEAEFGVSPAFGGMEWLRARYCGHAFDLHAHNEYVIAVVEEGAEIFRCRGETHVAPADSIYTINPGESHDGRAAAGGWRYSAIYPSQFLVERVLGEYSARAFERVVWSDAEAIARFRAMHALLGGDCALTLESALVLTLARLFEVNATGMGCGGVVRDGRGVSRVHELLQQCYAERHTLEALAIEADLHPNYLLAAFKRRYGMTPSVFLRTQRLQRAQIMLRAGKALKAVAQDTGFFDQAHLSRCFRSAFGVTPSAYARVHRLGRARD
jgi:AraC-like DNA-binding protein